MSPTVDLNWSPEELIRRVEAAGLRGRGGGWFPVARKWRAVGVEGGKPVVIANGAEGEPGSIKDRWLMLHRPERVLEGLRIAARAVGAHEAIVYLKGSFVEPARALEAALSRTPLDGLAVRVARGAESYVAGEETAVLEVLEGRKAWPREKPPYPAAIGLQGRPTLVQNVETLSRVAEAVSDPEGFRSGERTLVSVWGHVRRPGVYELPLGKRLADIVNDEGGGTEEPLGWLFPAGPSASPLRADRADLALDPEVLRAAGSGLGSATLLVVKDSLPPLALAVSLAAFFERESCGQCPPCVVGAGSLARITRSLAAGQARPVELGRLREVAGFMEPHGYCAHARTAARAVTGFLAQARESVEAALGGAATAGLGGPFDEGSLERQAIEACLSS